VPDSAANCGCHETLNAAIRVHLWIVEAQCHKRGIDEHSAEWDDAYSDGQLALWHAIEDYDPARGMKSFEAFAAYKVRYAVLSSIRRRTGRSRWRPESIEPLDETSETYDLAMAGLVEDVAADRAELDRALEVAEILDKRLPTIVLLLATKVSLPGIAEHLNMTVPQVKKLLELLPREVRA
jgi:RNA polymerase sigma factor (sigma-70 family)